MLIAQSRDADSLVLLRLAIFESPRFPDIAQAIHQASLEVIEPLRAYLRHLQHSGKLGEADTDLVAQDLVDLCSAGYRFLLVADAPTPDAERILAVYLRGLGFRQEPAPKTNGHI